MKELSNLNARRTITMAAIRLLSDDKSKKAKEAILHYQGQLAEIDKKIEEITGKPPPIAVGLKTASIFPKVR